MVNHVRKAEQRPSCWGQLEGLDPAIIAFVSIENNNDVAHASSFTFALLHKSMPYYEQLATGETVEFLALGPFTITARCNGYDQVCGGRLSIKAPVLRGSLVGALLDRCEELFYLLNVLKSKKASPRIEAVPRSIIIALGARSVPPAAIAQGFWTSWRLD